jgi:rhamnose utilization protein RhaD (predicted bifunctional aldolase and dehydrogenase)
MVELDQLRKLSARVGADPLLVQAAGGNTSLKDDGIMWIKASGTWLKDAQARDIFVPLDHAAIMSAQAQNDPACESCTAFVRTDLNSTGLRPSIETTVHALMPQRVVVHVHCVNTIAWAIRADGEQRLAEKLASFNWAYIPYARPGLPLAGAITATFAPASMCSCWATTASSSPRKPWPEAEALLDRVSPPSPAPYAPQHRPTAPHSKSSVRRHCLCSPPMMR